MPRATAVENVLPDPGAVVENVRAAMPDALVGAYLFGSATLGGMRPHSDVDVLGVMGRRTTEAERHDLVQRLLPISGSPATGGPARPLELTLVVRADLKPWRYPPRREFLYGEWLRREYERGLVPEPEVNPDLATVLTMVLRSGRSVIGPPVVALLDPVPASDLRRALLDSLPALLDDLDTDGNVLLTLARAWLTLATGRIAPKDVAADWALARMPARLGLPLAGARDVYLGRSTGESLDVPAVRTAAAWLVPRIAAAYAHPDRAA